MTKSRSSFIPYLVALATGAIISVMVTCNTETGVRTSSEVSLIINQIVGIVFLSGMMVGGRKSTMINPPRRSAGAIWWFGGLFGIVIISANYYSMIRIGATMSMAAAVFGQSLMGLIIDYTGFLGMKKQRFSIRKISSLLISFAGILVMASFSGGSFDLISLLLGIMAGCATMIQMSYNSHFAALKGPFFSARQNVISGLGGALLYAFAFHGRETIAGFKAMGTVSPLLLVSGGLLACFVVVSTNMIIPKIPAVYSALLLSSGQILTSLLIDKVLYDRFSFPLLWGTILMLVGIIALPREDANSPRKK